MHFDGTFRYIGAVDPAPLAHAIESMGEGAWLEYVGRQQTYQVHRNTFTIPLLFDQDGRHADPTRWPRMAELEPVLEPVLQAIREANGCGHGADDNGYFIRIILTRLTPETVIPPHRDGGESLKRAHRYHVPIVTDQRVKFMVGGDVRSLAPGEIWEINNRAQHAVSNQSDRARIHLILDYVVPGERVDDPKGMCIA